MSESSEGLADLAIDAGLAPDPRVTPGSLEERVAKRRDALESATTDLFDVPGFDGIFQVELRLVGGKRQHKIILENERIRDEYQQVLRSSADLILAATVGFHAVIDAEGATEPAEGTTWRKLAGALPHVDEAVLERPGGGRVALISLVGESGVLELLAEWRQWMRTRGQKVERSLEEDF